MRRAPLILSAVVIALTGCGMKSSGQRSSYFGVNAQYVFARSPSTWGPQLDAMGRAGIGLVRSDAYWHKAEKRPPVRGRHTFNWRFADRIVVALAKRRLRWQPVIAYSAHWAESVPGEQLSPPVRMQDYADYARAFVARYGPRGSFWRAHRELPRLPVTAVEIWNEPNWPVFWQPAPDPARYGDMYLRARASIRAADPNVRVMLGGLTIGSGDFLDAMLRFRPDARGNIDAIALHSYGATPEVAVAVVAELRRRLIALGEGSVPLEITEFGWTTSGNSGYVVPEQTRASYIAAFADTIARGDCGVGAVFLYAWTTNQRSFGDPEDWYGVYDSRARQTASGASYNTVARALDRERPWTKPPTARRCT
jgi:hypothetical protein